MIDPPIQDVDAPRASALVDAAPIFTQTFDARWRAANAFNWTALHQRIGAQAARLDELDAIASTRELTESEAWQRLLLREARGSTPAVLEDLRAWAVTHPTDAPAKLQAGRSLLSEQDESGIPLIEQAILLAEESGSAEARGRALRFAGQLHLYRRELDAADAALESARGYLAEAGAAWSLGRTLNFAAWVARRKGELPRAERLFRESIRILTPLEDRATLCESQRALAELLLEENHTEEAERFALVARETVGPHDVTSISTTTMTLGLVRAAQGRDEEAEELLRDAWETIAATEHRSGQRDALKALAQFLAERGREDEAAELEARREDVLAEAESAAKIA